MKLPQRSPDAPPLPGARLRIRPEVAGLTPSKILEVWQMGFEVPDVLGLWVGEGDLPTPSFICEKAAAALRAGETFYTHKRGLPELRQALIDYHARLYGVRIDDRRLAVTSAGMNAMMLAMQTLIGAGDNLVAVTPVWPNGMAAAEIMGGSVRHVPLGPGPAGWRLDVERLFAACDEKTRAIYVTSPGNPTGWLMPREQQRAVMEFCRRRGIWVIADEVYARFVYDRPVAPSFLEVAEADDPLIVVNSFSKAWAMTGWRLGWMIYPAALAPQVDSLIEYNTSGAQAFLQRACIEAVLNGEPFVHEMVARCRAGRDLVMERLAAMARVRVSRPEAAFYVMFEVEGEDDSMALAKRLVVEARVGLAPGTAFGPGGPRHLRLCYACGPERLQRAMDRLQPHLG